MKGRGTVGRADLLHILSKAGDDLALDERVGILCGFDYDAAAILREDRTECGGEPEQREPSQRERRSDPAFVMGEPDPIRFLIGSIFRPNSENSFGQQNETRRSYEGWRNAPPPPKWLPLAPWSALEPALRTLLAPQRATQRVDVREATRRLSKAKPLLRPPFRERARWPRHLTVVLDRSTHLVPFWRDQDLVLAALCRHIPDCVIDTLTFDDHKGAFIRFGEVIPLDEIVGTSPEILVLGDLGAVSGKSIVREVWLELGRRLPAGFARVLSPVPESNIDARSREIWQVGRWARHPGSGSSEELAEELLRLISPAIRIEPNLLRQVRVAALPHTGPEIEALVWNHPAMEIRQEDAGALRPEIAKRLRQEFALLDREKRRAAILAMRNWRGDLHSGVWFEEVLDLDADSRTLVPIEDVTDANAFFAHTHDRTSNDPDEFALLRWCDRMGDRAVHLGDNDYARALIWRAKKDDPDFADFDPGSVPPTTTPVGALSVSVLGGTLLLGPPGAIGGSSLGLAMSGDGLIRIDPAIPSFLPLSSFRDNLSDGPHGPEMISIPTGSFLMGSPDGDEDRFDDEGPQHRVEIAEPFALAKYPVTFEQYDTFCEATGREKAQDEGWGRGRRPAINVNWEDARAYCDWLSVETSEAYRLPSEAEWEYACRAGMTTRYWWGDEWEPERANGARNVGKTSEVGSYAANEWSLHDTHGNVWEWCEDLWQDDYTQPRSQAAFHSSSGGTNRVIRGGSWYDYARSCRAAYRSRFAPVNRNFYLGFRPARGQASGAQVGKQGNAERSGLRSGEGSGAEPRQERSEGQPSQRDGESKFSGREIKRLRVMPGGSTSISLSELPPAPFVIRTDRAELTIQRITRTDLGVWASGMGRDCFGLWADFVYSDVRQRMRFCPPGQFQIGSPEDEAGRDDDEGTQTEITFSEGFWLFDTPVTQVLYDAVMGENPSRFISPTRPVEQVDWWQAWKFIDTLSAQVAGLELRLPSEAEWEYACRAGTPEATYAGPMEILGANNAPILDSIAWYGGNSGIDFDLDEGRDSSGWPEKQHEHSKAGTRPVKLKRANPWGLHDMIGNVWEWCEDEWHDSHEGASFDGLPRPPSQHDDGGSGRVLRGGSWGHGARGCRAAFRYGYAPGDRYNDLGFRPARGQVSGAPAGHEKNAERSDLRSDGEREAEPRSERSEGSPPQGGGESISSRLGKRFWPKGED